MKLILFLMLSFSVNAQNRGTDPEKVSFQFATLFRTHQVYHGALIFDGPTLFPGISLDFYQKVTLRGPNIEYYKQIGLNRFTLGSRFFDDEGFGLTRAQDRRKNESREFGRQAWDIYLRADFKFLNRINYRFLFSTDLREHYGQYLYSEVMFPILPLTKIGYGLGIGDIKHNRFLYGPSARSGTGHQDFIVNVFIPFLPAKGILIARFTQVLTHFKQNRRATYVNENDHPKVLTIIASWNIGNL